MITKINDLQTKLYAGGFRQIDEFADDENYYDAAWHGKGLRLRLVKSLDQYTVKIANKRTFDRWANSVNFIVPFWPKNILQVTWEARRIIQLNGNAYYWKVLPPTDLGYIAKPYE